MAANPFDRLHLGYEALFGPKTRFMHVPPTNQTGTLIASIEVPVLHLGASGASWVEAGTIGTVVASFLGLCLVLFMGLGKGKGAKKVEKKKQ
jgi:hypothetical protein